MPMTFLDLLLCFYILTFTAIPCPKSVIEILEQDMQLTMLIPERHQLGYTLPVSSGVFRVSSGVFILKLL